ASTDTADTCSTWQHGLDWGGRRASTPTATGSTAATVSGSSAAGTAGRGGGRIGVADPCTTQRSDVREVDLLESAVVRAVIASVVRQPVGSGRFGQVVMCDRL